MPTSRREQVRQAVRAIRDFYTLGQTLPAKASPGAAYGERAVRRAAEAVGTSDDTIRKARAFADPVDGYTPAELDELCDLVQAVQPGQTETGRWVFRPTHVIRLLSVRPKGRRKALQARAVKNGWSTARLEAEIAKRFGTRRAGGRWPAAAKTPDDFLAQAEKLCETWRRWAARLAEPGEEAAAARGTVPARLRAPLDSATEAVRALHRVVLEELSRRRPDRDPRPGVAD